MCAGAIVLARIPLVVWGVSDPLRGGAVSRFRILQTPELNHRAEVLPGVLEGECAAVLKGFFRQRRIENKGARDELRETSDERRESGGFDKSRAGRPRPQHANCRTTEPPNNRTRMKATKTTKSNHATGGAR